MKIIFLNIWNAKTGKPFIDFINQHADSTDIFCFQEANDESKQLLEDVLSGFEVFSAYRFVAKEQEFPQAIYIKKGIDTISAGEVLREIPDCGLAIYVQVKVNDKDLYICNFHGISRPVDKLDNPARLKQSEGLIAILKDKKGMRIIGGDFNLLPETKSIQLFEEYGYKDLIKDYKIESTRNKISWNKYPDNTRQYFADYVFVSQDVRVKEFQVPYNEISDHLPLILEIEL